MYVGEKHKDTVLHKLVTGLHSNSVNQSVKGERGESLVMNDGGVQGKRPVK